MSGAPDGEHLAARRALVDAPEARDEHRDSIVVVGAQAVYLLTGAADRAVAEFTTDADREARGVVRCSPRGHGLLIFHRDDAGAE